MLSLTYWERDFGREDNKQSTPFQGTQIEEVLRGNQPPHNLVVSCQTTSVDLHRNGTPYRYALGYLRTAKPITLLLENFAISKARVRYL